MKFELSTKPFADALDLGVIPGNISKYYRLSCLAQLTATKNELHVNLEASNVYTELILKGRGDEDGPAVAFVDCLVLKQLVRTFESNTTTIEYTEGALVLHSGSSKFTLPFLADSEDGELHKPSPADPSAVTVPLDLDDWKFVKDHQMYAVAASFVKREYTLVWVGEDGDVIAGDFDNSLFTFSKKSKLGKTCLLSESIINLFNSLPEGASITLMDKSYRVDVKTDGFEYASEFSPLYENEGNIKSYCAPEIMASIVKDTDNEIKVPVAPISKFLSQSDLLSSGTDTKINFSVVGDSLRLYDDNVDCKIKFEGSCKEFTTPMNTKFFNPIISHPDAETLSICPVFDEDGNVVGLTIWTDNLTTVVGSVDDEEA